MRAMLLAAGRGRRLGRLGDDIPKCLIRIDGQTLLQRHFRCFNALGIRAVTLVVGYRADDVTPHLEALRPLVDQLDVCMNEEFMHGNVLSLRHGLRSLQDDGDVIVMDTDVLYPRRLLIRLLESNSDNAVLLDPSAAAGGEEMMVGARGPRVHRIRRDLDVEAWETVGETVGFLKVRGGDIPALLTCVDRTVEAKGPDQEYEEAYELFFAERTVGFAAVDDLPWTEIDFPEDIERATREVLPRVAAMDAEDTPLNS